MHNKKILLEREKFKCLSRMKIKQLAILLSQDRAYGPDASEFGDVRLSAHERPRDFTSGPITAAAGSTKAPTETPAGPG